MPFQLLPEKDREDPPFADLALLVIRVISVTAFFYYQLAEQFPRAFRFLWDGEVWELVGRLEERNYPVPGVLAPLALGLVTAGLLGVLFGFLTRFNALVLAALAGFLLFSALPLSTTLNPQATVLYLGIFTGFAWGGAGRISLDRLLAGRRGGSRSG